MPHSRFQLVLVLTLSASTLGSLGCASMTPTENGMLGGGTLGALGGAIIGHQSGHRTEGALIGGLLGMLGGGMMGRNQELRQERDQAIIRASHLEQQQAAALSNWDVIRMCNSGISPTIIVQSIETQPNNFDLTSDSLIMLTQSGVPEEVITAMQRNQNRKVKPVNVVAPAPRPVVIVEEAPVIYHHHPWYYRHRHRHHHHHSGLHIHADF